ncbi:major histocompatibility complex class I-related protein 1-like isoform X2 [Pogona vitticeps]
MAVDQVNDHDFNHYNSTTRVARPQADWLKKMEEEDPSYWGWRTLVIKNAEQRLSKDLEILKQQNESRGLHTWQHMYGCELSSDGSLRGFSQYSYNGRDFISFDKETLTWTATSPLAQVLKLRLDNNLEYSKYVKAYQEEICVKWLKKFLEYGNTTLLRTELPVAKLKRREVYASGWETLVCEIYGFYPKEIDAFWRKDGEVWMEDTFHRNVAPNPDGTYHAWTSVEIDPKERDLYRCQVEHGSLAAPLVLAWREQASVTDSNTELVAFVLSGVVGLAVLLGTGFLLCRRHPQAEGADKEEKRRFPV